MNKIEYLNEKAEILDIIRKYDCDYDCLPYNDETMVISELRALDKKYNCYNKIISENEYLIIIKTINDILLAEYNEYYSEYDDDEGY
jgi:hypothetical protein